MPNQFPQIMTLEDFSLPSIEEIERLEDGLLRFFDDDEHSRGEDCQCRPQIVTNPRAKSGYSIVHNPFNIIPRCSLNP